MIFHPSRVLANIGFLVAFLVMIFFVAVVASVVVVRTMHPVYEYKCSDFTTFSDAKGAYDRGAVKLDGNNNGVPCENLITGVGSLI